MVTSPVSVLPTDVREAVNDAIDAPVSAPGAVIIVTGDPGTGKTTIARALEAAGLAHLVSARGVSRRAVEAAARPGELLILDDVWDERTREILEVAVRHVYEERVGALLAFAERECTASLPDSVRARARVVTLPAGVADFATLHSSLVREFAAHLPLLGPAEAPRLSRVQGRLDQPFYSQLTLRFGQESAALM